VGTSEDLSLTSEVLLESTVHGRQRRAERAITKKDLQSAIKYGTKEPGWPDPRTKEPRWKYTFRNIVYITDHTSTKEVTSYPEAVEVHKKTVSAAMRAQHAAASALIRSSPESWTSHTVLVIDQSGSMRTSDMADCKNRADAVWVSLSLDWVAVQLEGGGGKGSDVVSLVAMNDTADVILRHRPVDWLLFNDLLDLRQSLRPRSHGNYLPALDAAEDLFYTNTCGGCALQLLFLSDGQPSDRVTRGPGTTPQKRLQQATSRISALASRFGRRLTIGTIGLGGGDEDFSVLEAMAQTAKDYDVVSFFKVPSLTSASLGDAFTSLASSLTDTRTEMTEIGGHSQRKVREVVRESRKLADDSEVNDDWWVYRDCDRAVVQHCKWDLDQNDWVETEYSSPQAVGVALREPIFGEGAERMVHKFREVDRWDRFVGPKLVAKESRFLEHDHNNTARIQFHKMFCKTQAWAQRAAAEFNRQLANAPGVDNSTPRISFLECSVYILDDVSYGTAGVLVEKMIDPAAYMKWNNNKGNVHGQDRDAEEQRLANLADQESRRDSGAGLGVLQEGDEEEEEEDSDDDQAASIIAARHHSPSISPEDVPQAFSHFTYRHSNRKVLVCDLQGVLNTSVRPAMFELTDPVIHSRKKGSYGRTDAGEKGWNKFFCTHECNELCRRLHLPKNRRKDEAVRRYT
jgi:hypothetical protein